MGYRWIIKGAVESMPGLCTSDAPAASQHPHTAFPQERRLAATGLANRHPSVLILPTSAAI